MAIQISGCTVIDNSRNITNANNMCVGVVTMTGSSGDIETPGTITAGGLDFPPIPITFNPANGETDVNESVNIIITFNQQVQKGTGNITLRSGSAGGTILQTIAVTSGSVTISNSVVTITPPSSLPTSTNVFVVVDAGAFTNINIDTDNAIINTYSFTTQTIPSLGCAYEGGFLICCASPTRWVVAPDTSQVSRNWDLRNDANTRAQQVSGCTGWFVPTVTQLQNPGYTCRTFWDSFSSTDYWSSTENSSNYAWRVSMVTGDALISPGGRYKSAPNCVRAFRCVTY
jgi:hypothetical protein